MTPPHYSPSPPHSLLLLLTTPPHQSPHPPSLHSSPIPLTPPLPLTTSPHPSSPPLFKGTYSDQRDPRPPPPLLFTTPLTAHPAPPPLHSTSLHLTPPHSTSLHLTPLNTHHHSPHPTTPPHHFPSPLLPTTLNKGTYILRPKGSSASPYQVPLLLTTPRAPPSTPPHSSLHLTE